MQNNLQNINQGVRANTSRPSIISQVAQVQHQRDTSLNATRQSLNKQQSKRYSQSNSTGVTNEHQENLNHQNISQEARVAYKPHEPKEKISFKSSFDVQETNSLIKNISQPKSKSKEAPFRQLNSQSKPPVMFQSTDSPPSCSLTCSPDRTTKKQSTIIEEKLLSERNKMLVKNFNCSVCKTAEKFIPYDFNANFGNCELCGNFRNLTSASLGLSHVIESIRDDEQKYRTEVPMDIILEKLIEDANLLNPAFNPDAFYLNNREVFIDWMFELAEKLQVQPETFHHSINLFDAYLMRTDITKHLSQLTHFQGQTKHNVVTLIALTSIFISAKYLEKTYPGINQLLNYIGIPYCYEEFIAQEKDMLETLGWQIQFISIHNILSHFLCQGILFTSDRLAGQTKPDLYTVQVLQHNCEIFTSLCLKKFEFLRYDQLTVASAIIMAARKICHLQELWPDELVAMTGNRLRQPQLKTCMRHIISFYDEISCSNTNTQQSSPEHPSQKTVKRTQQTQISTKKKSRGNLNCGGDKSQEQTTSKKATNSVSRTGNSTANVTGSVITSQAKVETVVTPAKNSMPRNQSKVTSIIKSQGDKNQQAHAVKRSVQNAAGQPAILRSVTKNDLSNIKDESRFIKSIESRADSQPAKKTHSLTKQDSSVYLKGSSLDKVIRRSQRSSQLNQASFDQRNKSVATGVKSVVATSIDRQSVNSQQITQHQHTLSQLQQIVAATSGDGISATKDTKNVSGGNNGNSAPYFLHKQSQYSKYSVVSASHQQQPVEAPGSSGKLSMGGSLKKVIHPLLRQTNTVDNHGSFSHPSVTTSLNKTKLINSEKSVTDANQMNQQIRSNSVGFSNNLTTTAQTKTSNNENVPHQEVGTMQQRSLAKQFEQMELRSKKGFVVNTLTTANQRASSSKSGTTPNTTGLNNFVSKLVGQSKMSNINATQTPEQTEILTSILKLNSLTSNPNDQIIETRSGSVGTNSSSVAHKQQNLQKLPSTQRETNTSGTNIVVSEPKVISCNYKQQQPRFDYSSIQALMCNLKQTSTSTGCSSNSSVPAKHQFARSTSRGKETSALAQANKLTSMLGKPLTMAGRNNQVTSSVSGGIGTLVTGGSSGGLSNNFFHPRPQNLRVKMKQTSSEINQSQIVAASHRQGVSQGKP